MYNIKKITLIIFAILQLSLLFSDVTRNLSVTEEARRIENFVLTSQIPNTSCHRRPGVIIFETDIEGAIVFKARQENVSVREMPGEYWVYVKPGERAISVYTDNYDTFEFVLREHGITSLREGEAWRVRLVGQRDVYTTIAIRFTPNDADLYFNEVKVDNPRSIRAKLGYNLIRIEKENYVTIEEEIYVTQSEILFEYEMEKYIRYGDIEIKVVPNDAFIELIRKEEHYETSFMGSIDLASIPVGIYQLRITADKYKPFTETIHVVEDSVIYREVELEEINVISITSEPTGADIFLNGIYYGKTPFNKEIDKGDYELLVKQGKEFNRKGIRIDSADKNEYHFNLIKRDMTGFYTSYNRVRDLYGANVGLILGRFGIGYLHYFLSKSEDDLRIQGIDLSYRLFNNNQLYVNFSANRIKYCTSTDSFYDSFSDSSYEEMFFFTVGMAIPLYEIRLNERYVQYTRLSQSVITFTLRYNYLFGEVIENYEFRRRVNLDNHNHLLGIGLIFGNYSTK